MRHDIANGMSRKTRPDAHNGYDLTQVVDRLLDAGVPYEDELAPARGDHLEDLAATLGEATKAAVTASAGPGTSTVDLADEAARAARAEAAAAQASDHRARLIERRKILDEEITAVETAPDHHITRMQVTLNKLGKLAFFAGDTAVIAGPLYASGLELPMAVATGIAVSFTAVSTGTYVGAVTGAQARRRARGDAPQGIVAGVKDLYHDPSGPSFRSLLALVLVGFALAVLVAVAIMIMLVGDGESFGHAAGAGLFAGVTFAGSAMLEAWSSNPAAARLHGLRARADEITSEIEALDRILADAPAAGARIAELRELISGDARAAGLTTYGLLAGQRVLYPRVFTYDRVEAPMFGPSLTDLPVTNGRRP